MVRILIIEDHQIIREGLKCLLSKMPDIHVVGDAQDGPSAIGLVEEFKTLPDLVIMDLCMPDMDGIEVSRRILKVFPQVKIIMLTMFGDYRLVERSLHAGVRGYVLKGCSSNELMAAIHSVMKGDFYLSPIVEKEIVNRYISRLRHDQARSEAALTIPKSAV